MNRAVKLYGLLLCTWLMACMCISCSEDVIEDNPAAQQGKKGSVSFLLSGIDAGVSTRAAHDIDFSQYSVKCYVFEQNEGSKRYDCTWVQEIPVSKSFFTINGLTEDKFHCFVFLAVKKEHENFLQLKEYTSKSGEITDHYANYSAPQNAVINTSKYEKCFLQVFNESGLGQAGGFLHPLAEDFMVYGVQAETVPTSTDYTMQKVTLKRLMGAVEFEANDAGNITECNVFSNFYRLYFSQMKYNNPTTLNGATGIDNGGENWSDFAGNWTNVNDPSNYTTATLKKEFSQETKKYRIFLPCTTIQEYSENNEIPEVQRVNTMAGTLNSYDDPELDVPINPTSVTINGKKYITKSSFPVFPNRITVFKVNDGNHLEISFKGLNGSGGIDVDNDDWDGWKD